MMEALKREKEDEVRRTKQAEERLAAKADKSKQMRMIQKDLNKENTEMQKAMETLKREIKYSLYVYKL